MSKPPGASDAAPRITSYPAVCSPDCTALVLGTAPSVASLEAGGHYGHKRNAFWPILFALWGMKDPGDYAARYSFMLSKGIALWDVLHSCERQGSLDSAIKNPLPNDIDGLLAACPHIDSIFCNGGTAHTLLRRYFPHLRAVKLPSTSPAAARLTFDQKLAQWMPLREATRGQQER